ncbi:MAG: hypothetical protein ACLFWR_00265 [Acidimicrobiales bacterium]
MGLFGKSKKTKKANAAVETPEVFGNQHLSGKAQSIGQDSANEVFKVNYKDQYAMGGETGGYFKPDADMAPARNAVAASRLAQGMGWGDLIAETHFASHDVTDMHGKKRKGVQGAVSRGAKGDALMSPVFDTLKENHKGGSTDTVKVRGGKGYELSGFEMNGDIDMSKSNTQKQLNQLQWFDMLIGNEDRHGANILIDPDTGKVTGIDNDLSFGRGMQAKKQWGKQKGKEEDEDFTKGRDGKYLGLPGQIDRETADALLGLGPAQISEWLAPEGGPGNLSEEEIEGVYQRLAVIQREVAKYEDDGKIVSNWDDSTYNDALNAQVNRGNFNREIPRSYLQRHDKALTRASDPTDTDWWRKGKRATDSPGSLGLPVPQAAPPPVPQPAPTPTPAPTPAWSAAAKPSSGPRPSGLALGSNRGTGTATATKPASRQKPVLDRLKGTPFEGM